MTSEPTPLTAPTEPMHGCVRCGARIPTSESMCERCNPLGLKSPAASQAHGTALVGIVLFVVVMAVAGRLLIANVGPFRAAVSSVEADTVGLKVTISITNEGSSEGSTTCRIDDPATGGIGTGAIFIESPKVPGGGTATFDVVVTSFGSEVKPMLVDCGA